MTVFLPDVNVLIALIDPAHIHHDAAHDWFAREGRHRWATCPLTENGVIRIVSHPGYPANPGPPGAIAELLSRLCDLPGHEFWRDDISLLDTARIHHSRLLNHAQVTDSYLLALARAHDGKLATFDRRLVVAAVRDGGQNLQTLS